MESHLQTQRAAVKMLHDRIMLLVQYVSDAIAGSILRVLFARLVSNKSIGSATKDHATLRALSALIASLPASENKGFREEFDTEYEDVQLTANLASLTKSANILNDVRVVSTHYVDAN